MVAQYSAPGGVRPRGRLLAGAVCSILVTALVAAGCSAAGRPAGRPASRPGEAAASDWVCRPRPAAGPCPSSPAATAVTAGGTLNPATWPQSASASKFDCFYVHPTDSLAKTANTG